MKYRQKPVEAIQWTGKNLEELKEFTFGDFYRKTVDFGTGDATLKTLKGEIRVGRFEFIVKGVNGDHYSCDPDIFEQTYEAVITIEQVARR